MRPAAGLEEVKWIGAEANLTHGRPLKSKEYREVFRAYIRAGKHRKGRRFKGYREIAEDLRGMHPHATIWQWMRRDFPQIAGRMGRADEFRAKGGLDDRSHGPEDHLYRSARVAVETIANTVKALSNESYRGELIVALEQALADLEAKPHVRPVPEPETMDF